MHFDLRGQRPQYPVRILAAAPMFHCLTVWTLGVWRCSSLLNVLFFRGGSRFRVLDFFWLFGCVSGLQLRGLLSSFRLSGEFAGGFHYQVGFTSNLVVWEGQGSGFRVSGFTSCEHLAQAVVAASSILGGFKVYGPNALKPQNPKRYNRLKPSQSPRK